MLLPLSISDNMHALLRMLYDDMMPLCGHMTRIASAIAGLGALLYISYRVWQSMARGEAIDLFPLLRPFALGLCIMLFQPLVLGGLNGILSPVVTGAHQLLTARSTCGDTSGKRTIWNGKASREIPLRPITSPTRSSTGRSENWDGLPKT